MKPRFVSDECRVFAEISPRSLTDLRLNLLQQQPGALRAALKLGGIPTEAHRAHRYVKLHDDAADSDVLPDGRGCFTWRSGSYNLSDPRQTKPDTIVSRVSGETFHATSLFRKLFGASSSKLDELSVSPRPTARDYVVVFCGTRSAMADSFVQALQVRNFLPVTYDHDSDFRAIRVRAYSQEQAMACIAHDDFDAKEWPVTVPIDSMQRPLALPWTDVAVADKHALMEVGRCQRALRLREAEVEAQRLRAQAAAL